MRKIQVNVAGVSTLVEEDKLIQIIIGQDESGNDIVGDYYKHYNADMTLDMVTINKEAQDKLISDGESIVITHIQEPIDKYNKDNGTKFESVYNCNVYTAIETYPHQQFCIDIVAFNASVWDTARIKQSDGSITSDTTAEQFKAMLPALL